MINLLSIVIFIDKEKVEENTIMWLRYIADCDVTNLNTLQFKGVWGREF